MPKRRGAQVTIPEPYEDVSSLYRVALTTKELVETLAGQRGDPNDRAVTWGEFRPPEQPRLPYQPAPTAETWNPIPFLNGWANYASPYSPCEYRKLSSGVVIVKGLTQGGSGAICQLPVGYRPGIQMIYPAETSPNATCRLDVDTSGSVYHTGGNNGWLSLSSIFFFAEN